MTAIIATFPTTSTSSTLSSAEEKQEMNRETAIFLTTMFVLVAYALTGASIFLAAAAMLGGLYVIPQKYMRKLFGYLFVADLSFSVWLAGLAAASLGGLQLAVLAGLLYTVITRELRSAWGSEKISINGETEYGKQAACILTQGVSWMKAIWAGIRSGAIIAPKPMHIAWVEEDKGGGFKATRAYNSYVMIKEKIVSYFQKAPVAVMEPEMRWNRAI